MIQLPDVKKMSKIEAFCIFDNVVIIAAISTTHKMLEIVTTFDG